MKPSLTSQATGANPGDTLVRTGAATASQAGLEHAVSAPTAGDKPAEKGDVMALPFDRRAENVGNIVHLEHVNLAIDDQRLATLFYITGLGLTRDPYLMTGVDIMWVNAGDTQFHLLQGMPQKLRGRIEMVIPNRTALATRLNGVAAALSRTLFRIEEQPGWIDVTCPWGNRLRCFEPSDERFGGRQLGIGGIRFDVPVDTAVHVARFYTEVFHAPSRVVEQNGALSAVVPVGRGQRLTFTETQAALDAYDGHHIQVYVSDFSGPHERLLALNGVTEESNTHQFRFVDIVDPSTGEAATKIEHEVRSMTHPLFGRVLVNRNADQSARNYRRGRDKF